VGLYAAAQGDGGAVARLKRCDLGDAFGCVCCVGCCVGCVGLFWLAGRAGLGTKARATLLRSCPPAAFGAPPPLLRCEESPEPPCPRMACRLSTFAGGAAGLFGRGLWPRRAIEAASRPAAIARAGALGLTRITCLPAGIPFLDGRKDACYAGLGGRAGSRRRNPPWGRLTTPANGGLRTRLPPTEPRRSGRLPIVHHDKERRQASTRFASGPDPGQGAGRGSRRGLDGPSRPRTPTKN